MVGSTSVETLDEFLEMHELNPYLLIVAWYMNVAYALCYFMSSNNFHKKEVNFLYIGVQEEEESREMF